MLLLVSQLSYFEKFNHYFTFLSNANMDQQVSLRYGTNSYNYTIFSDLSFNQILFGSGFPAVTSIDSGILWYILQGGIIDVVLIACFFLIWFIKILNFRASEHFVFAFLCYLITCMTFIADPINIMKRSSIIFVIVVYYTISLGYNYRQSRYRKMRLMYEYNV